MVHFIRLNHRADTPAFAVVTKDDVKLEGCTESPSQDGSYHRGKESPALNYRERVGASDVH